MGTIYFGYNNSNSREGKRLLSSRISHYKRKFGEFFPEVKGKKFISDQSLPKVQANNITNKLYRVDKNYPNCVTNVRSTRLSRTARQGYMAIALSNVVYGDENL
ncbi:hypothetical protein TNIN_184071 [Trichonephila inaurata madagascariensis]|uniref:Uncharacterized protein n=1 Tax=Trichonephila inaurata madagascariensis TaxID=2747483 RepID=A0A8X6Y372_9ARAC|nr:hypothetical protein TNIN_184071 [Trichonephila inaurata madagascariensis]